MNTLNISTNCMMIRSGYNRDRDRVRRAQNRDRRRQLQVLKQKLLILIISIVLIVAVTIICGGFLADAKTSNEYREYKYFTQHTVQPGETLWEIASVYADEHYANLYDYIAEVKYMNHIEDLNEIKAGKVIMIPYYSEELK